MGSGVQSGQMIERWKCPEFVAKMKKRHDTATVNKMKKAAQQRWSKERAKEER